MAGSHPSSFWSTRFFLAGPAVRASNGRASQEDALADSAVRWLRRVQSAARASSCGLSLGQPTKRFADRRVHSSSGIARKTRSPGTSSAPLAVCLGQSPRSRLRSAAAKFYKAAVPPPPLPPPLPPLAYRQAPVAALLLQSRWLPTRGERLLARPLTPGQPRGRAQTGSTCEPSPPWLLR